MLHVPGELVGTSGIYEVNHAGHRARHEAVLWAGERFPRCRECGEFVIFRFLQEVSEPRPLHASVDEDFCYR